MPAGLSVVNGETGRISRQKTWKVLEDLPEVPI